MIKNHHLTRTHAQKNLGSSFTQLVCNRSERRYSLRYRHEKAHTIRCVDIERKEVTTIAGSTNTKGMKDGAASKSLFCGPRGIAFSSRPYGLYVSDTLNHAVRFIKLDKSSSKAISVTTVCGGKDD